MCHSDCYILLNISRLLFLAHCACILLSFSQCAISQENLESFWVSLIPFFSLRFNGFFLSGLVPVVVF